MENVIALVFAATLVAALSLNVYDYKKEAEHEAENHNRH